MRRLITLLVAGLLAAGTVLTAGGAASAGATAARQPGCTADGAFALQFTSSQKVNYYPGTPNKTFSGATVRLKPAVNGTTMWTACFFTGGNPYLLTNRGLALTSRATSPGQNVTVETPGVGGDGFTSQHWSVDCINAPSCTVVTWRNQKTGLFLRIRNGGPSMGQTLTTGSSPTVWATV
jgi:hypothetical protein